MTTTLARSRADVFDRDVWCHSLRDRCHAAACLGWRPDRTSLNFIVSSGVCTWQARLLRRIVVLLFNPDGLGQGALSLCSRDYARSAVCSVPSLFSLLNGWNLMGCGRRFSICAPLEAGVNAGFQNRVSF